MKNLPAHQAFGRKNQDLTEVEVSVGSTAKKGNSCIPKRGGGKSILSGTSILGGGIQSFLSLPQGSIERIPEGGLLPFKRTARR